MVPVHESDVANQQNFSPVTRTVLTGAHLTLDNGKLRTTNKRTVDMGVMSYNKLIQIDPIHIAIYSWFAHPAPLYITYIAVGIAFIVHPILFILHTYRKFILPKRDEQAKRASQRLGTPSKIGSSKSKSRIMSAPSARGKNIGNIFKIKSDKEKINIIRNLTTITTLLSLFFGWIASIITFFNASSFITGPNSCLPISILQNVCWIITKLTIYQKWRCF